MCTTARKPFSLASGLPAAPQFACCSPLSGMTTAQFLLSPTPSPHAIPSLPHLATLAVVPPAAWATARGRRAHPFYVGDQHGRSHLHTVPMPTYLVYSLPRRRGALRTTPRAITRRHYSGSHHATTATSPPSTRRTRGYETHWPSFVWDLLVLDGSIYVDILVVLR